MTECVDFTLVAFKCTWYILIAIACWSSKITGLHKLQSACAAKSYQHVLCEWKDSTRSRQPSKTSYLHHQTVCQSSQLQINNNRRRTQWWNHAQLNYGQCHPDTDSITWLYTRKHQQQLKSILIFLRNFQNSYSDRFTSNTNKKSQLLFYKALTVIWFQKTSESVEIITSEDDMNEESTTHQPDTKPATDALSGILYSITVHLSA